MSLLAEWPSPQRRRVTDPWEIWGKAWQVCLRIWDETWVDSCFHCGEFYFFFFFWFRALSEFFLNLSFIHLFIFTLQYCVSFAIHWHESAMRAHVFPILNPPPTTLPTHPTGSSQCTSPKHLSHASNLDWRFISHMIIYIRWRSALEQLWWWAGWASAGKLHFPSWARQRFAISQELNGAPRSWAKLPSKKPTCEHGLLGGGFLQEKAVRVNQRSASEHIILADELLLEDRHPLGVLGRRFLQTHLESDSASHAIMSDSLWPPWAVAWAPLSMEFSRQEYQGG